MSAITKDQIQLGDDIVARMYGAVSGSLNIAGKVVSRLQAFALPAESTVPSDHVNIYRDLPEDVKAKILDDYQSYSYLAIQNVDNSIMYIGVPWIIDGTLELNTAVTANIELTGFRDADSESVKALLRANGYNVASITLLT